MPIKNDYKLLVGKKSILIFYDKPSSVKKFYALIS